jgi:hypothetical protein
MGVHPPVKSISNEKEYCCAAAAANPALRTLAGLKRLFAHVDCFRVVDDPPCELLSLLEERALEGLKVLFRTFRRDLMRP